MLRIEAWEMLEAQPTSNAVERWTYSLQNEANMILRKLCLALGGDVNVCEDPAQAADYLRNVPADKFVEVIASRAYSGWSNFFGIAPGSDPRGRAALKMLVKLARKSKVWGQNVANAFTGYFSDRVASKADNYRENVVYTIRLVGDPPLVPLGMAPTVALALTGVQPQPIPDYFAISGEPITYFDDAIAPFVRPAIVGVIVQTGVLARYAKDAGLDDLANTFLQTMATALQKFSALKKQDYADLVVSAEFASHPTQGAEAIHLIVEV